MSVAWLPVTSAAIASRRVSADRGSAGGPLRGRGPAQQIPGALAERRQLLRAHRARERFEAARRSDQRRGFDVVHRIRRRQSGQQHRFGRRPPARRCRTAAGRAPPRSRPTIPRCSGSRRSPRARAAASAPRRRPPACAPFAPAHSRLPRECRRHRSAPARSAESSRAVRAGRSRESPCAGRCPSALRCSGARPASVVGRASSACSIRSCSDCADADVARQNSAIGRNCNVFAHGLDRQISRYNSSRLRHRSTRAFEWSGRTDTKSSRR